MYRAPTVSQYFQCISSNLHDILQSEGVIPAPHPLHFADEETVDQGD